MPNFLFMLAQIPQPGAEQPASLFGADTILFFLAIGVMFYFLILRPQRQEAKQKQEALDSLKKGDPVVTIGGLHGTIAEIDKEAGTVMLQVDRNLRLKFNRTAIVPAPAKPEAAPAAPEKK